MKACRKCKFIVVNDKQCPLCGSKDLTEHFSGVVVIIDIEKSELAKILGLTHPGAYALKIKR